MADGKKKRQTKRSQGKHGGGGKVRLTRLELALLGKGPTLSAERKLRAAAARGAK